MKKNLAYLFETVAFGIQANGEVNRTKHQDNPVLPRGMSGEWDSVAIDSPSIIYDGTLYHIWYDGSDDSNTNIGHATSTDKINWEKYLSPKSIIAAMKIIIEISSKIY